MTAAPPLFFPSICAHYPPVSAVPHRLQRPPRPVNAAAAASRCPALSVPANAAAPPGPAQRSPRPQTAGGAAAPRPAPPAHVALRSARAAAAGRARSGAPAPSPEFGRTLSLGPSCSGVRPSGCASGHFVRGRPRPAPRQGAALRFVPHSTRGCGGSAPAGSPERFARADPQPQ